MNGFPRRVKVLYVAGYSFYLLTGNNFNDSLSRSPLWEVTLFCYTLEAVSFADTWAMLEKLDGLGNARQFLTDLRERLTETGALKVEYEIAEY
jgi:hypothetical protein